MNQHARLDPAPIPFIDVAAQRRRLGRSVDDAIARVLGHCQFILGPEVDAFEKEIAVYCRCRHAIGVSSGTDALLAALLAIDIKAGDEVITTPYSFFATTSAIVRAGATPVFVDIDRRTYNIDPAGIEAKISSRTRAIIPVHLFGQMADMRSIMEIARRHGLSVIEDAAQAIGAEMHGMRAGSVGDLGCFSFYPTKNLGGFGEAGMLTTNDPNLAERLRLLRNHGFKTKYDSKIVGWNFRLDEIQAAVLRVKFKHLDRWTEDRRKNASLYRQNVFQSTSVELPYDAPDSRHVYNQFVIRSERRDSLMASLRKAQIGCEIYYPIPLHLQVCFKNLGYEPGDFPVSEEAANRSLALPIYPELTTDMIGLVCDALNHGPTNS